MPVVPLHPPPATDAAGDGQDLAALLAEVRRIDVQAKRLVRSAMAGGYRSAFRGSGIEFDEVREYVEGDDPRTVDASVSARMGRPFVKKYVAERERTVIFSLDLSASMSAGFSAWSARQTAARVIACLALAAVRSGDKVGLVAWSDRVDQFVPPKKGLGHALRIVRDTLALRASSPRTDAGPALEFLARAALHGGHGAIVFVVSDFLAIGGQRALSLCARRHDVVAVRLRAPEFDGLGSDGAPRLGLLRVRDPETGAEHTLDLASEAVRADVSRRERERRAAADAELRRADVDVIDVPIPRAPTRDAIAGPLLRFFRMREMRGAKR